MTTPQWEAPTRALLAREGLEPEKVLRAMRRVDRAKFVPEDERDRAGWDCALPIGYGQTISQPSLVAAMIARLELEDSSRVLEIGTGCGYQAALLAELTPHTYTVEYFPELAADARANWRAAGVEGIHLRVGDGREGWPEEAPFDAILLAAAFRELPPALPEQLRGAGSRILGPREVGPEEQELTVWTVRGDGGLDREAWFPVRFVPLLS